ncbi:MAG: 2-oxoglutarate dehydrogenase complex dihydrolipoyllysine-residue succinyltransferase [Pseudomonadota bacterium]|nr:MAG: 2-oxoglutarate dehydrogenase complex dihydrolipoyllysine-residue succinyltransferase [Pseudomonadota bacterium]
MIVEIKAPVFPESIADGTITSWHKQPGQAVSRGETLVDIETDKVVFDTPAEQSGVLQDILCREGDTVLSGQVIARIDTAASAANAVPAVAQEPPGAAFAPFITPSASKLITERGLDSTQISGSGKDGRVLKEDVLRFLEVGQAAPAAEPATVQQPEPAFPAVPPTAAGERPEKRVPMTRLRARVAERLLEAQQTAAILTTFNEINMQPVMDLRRRYRAQFEKAHGVRLGFMSFFVKAVVEALRKFPEVNASIEDTDIVYHGYYDIGIAVGSPRGLVVPILRDADVLSMAQIEARVREYGEKAGEGTLSMDEITGGTFSITNGGVFGSLLSTPILNPPQSAILGMHKIEERPVAENGAVTIRPMMYVALSYDHRIIDGREAVQFLVTIKEQLEDPARILLGI